jgi:cyclic pyranopterin monophosphate synthase
VEPSGGEKRVKESHPEAEARMVDVTAKDVTAREAVAAGSVRMSTGTRDLLLERRLPKGDALEIARVAGIMGAKKTAELIPLCHPIAIGGVEVTFRSTPDGIDVSAVVRTSDRTGVEMEALTAVAVAALTIYDMVKGTERGVEVTGVRLLSKSGGRSGHWSREQNPEAS